MVTIATMTAAKKLPDPAPLTWEEYEAAEGASDERYEFLAGRMYAMAGATDNHNRIALNIASALHRLLEGKKCEPFMSDMKLKIALGADEFGYYPDVMVVCDPKGIHGTHVTKPTVIIEVLSDSTERIDRREKRLTYQSIRSLEVYAVVDQAKAEVTLYRRSTHWKGETVSGLKSTVKLPEIGADLTMQSIYSRVDWRKK